MCVCVCVCVYAHTHTHTHTEAYTYIHAHAHTYTHQHTRTQAKRQLEIGSHVWRETQRGKLSTLPLTLTRNVRYRCRRTSATIAVVLHKACRRDRVVHQVLARPRGRAGSWLVYDRWEGPESVAVRRPTISGRSSDRWSRRILSLSCSPCWMESVDGLSGSVC